LSCIHRANGANLDLGAAANGDQIVVAGVSVNRPGNASALFVCTAQPGSRSIGIPPEILQSLPPSQRDAPPDSVFGYLLVGALPAAAAKTFSASGLDAGILLQGSWSARAVIFQ
jgi:hypothetical protein